MNEPWVQIVGGILVLLGAGFTAQRAARATITASTQATAVEDRRVDLEEWRAMLAEVRSELVRVKAERVEDEARFEEIEREQRNQRQTLMVHSAWDYQAVTALRDKGIALPDPPPLYPPSTPQES